VRFDLYLVGEVMARAVLAVVLYGPGQLGGDVLVEGTPQSHIKNL